MQPTREIYLNFEKAYSYFNKALFSDALPPCLITMQRRKGARGYFFADRWRARGKDDKAPHVDEIALNPDYFTGCGDREILSDLVHEMCHLQQYYNGTPSRRGYHNKEWGQMMENVGLIPSHTGEEDGKQTGQKMDHYIEEGGAFEKACQDLFTSGVFVQWQPLEKEDEKTEKCVPKKTKYSCSKCDVKVWGKEKLNVKCGDCDLVLQVQA